MQKHEKKYEVQFLQPTSHPSKCLKEKKSSIKLEKNRKEQKKHKIKESKVSLFAKQISEPKLNCCDRVTIWVKVDCVTLYRQQKK